MGVLLLGMAIVYLVLSAVSRARFRRSARLDCPVVLSVDFSAPGTYKASFYSGSIVSADFLGLDVPESTAFSEPAAVRLSALQGTYRLVGPDGQAILSGPLRVELGRFQDPEFGHIIRLNRLDVYLSPETYQIEVSITQGVRALTGVPQRLILIGDHAGAGPLGSGLVTLIGYAALLVAAFVVIGVVVSSVRHKKRPENNTR